ncbi:hypothetical protein QCM77_35255 [Bradyrhizobium sp. SSUT18]|uniref:hypothetical protein n=1 Tax=unclassified Bradyrhizobium TaxID=2631580 RepID=UPI00244A602E|nr:MULTISPECIES: hypothetical protein [unclassified Bradyrhizobium]MDH2342381.1 hypothetical protein [Bradyrhizobium sp. SSUT77]MDH2405128.1 hypothetical protein [Bradyrhizobium sp. SSUT18]
MKPLAVVAILLAIGLVWWSARSGSSESLDAIHHAFEDCAGKFDDVGKIKSCVDDQLKSRGPHWYDVGADTLSIRNFVMATKFGPAPGDIYVSCSRLPRPSCNP